MRSICSQIAPIQDLPAILPDLLQDLSIGRAQIVVDQIRSLLDDGHQDCVLIVTAMDPESASGKPLAAAVAIHPPQRSGSASSPNDSATLLHASWIGEVPASKQARTIQVIKKRLDETLSQRGVTFVQWAWDENGSSEVSDAWFEGLGFQWVADLQYMTKSLVIESLVTESLVTGENATSAPAASEDAASAGIASRPLRLTLAPIDWESDSTLPAFANLVHQTYIETLDCPALLDYRSADQTIAGYQANASFAPECWFTVLRNSDNSPAANPAQAKEPQGSPRTSPGDPIGVVILARHNANRDPDVAPDDGTSPEVVELVYMGLVPAARGERLGADLMQAVIETAEGYHASRLILAVDQQNLVAGKLYRQFGLQSMLEESVWVKSL
ncbi:GNAT family N-acetyltransferase [Novipirellula sp. SH528]|uniref:GNAT family N-acetyltransferase n=1 Tax=Novipirellula sp. SH528 TaxID=3454466 RepID=UPI003F9F5D30